MTKYPSSKSKIIHIDIDPKVLGANYKTYISLVADAKNSLIQLNRKVKINNFYGDEIVKKTKRKKFAEFNILCKEEKGLIKPERIVKEINDAAPKNAYIVVDPGTPCPYFSAYYNFSQKPPLKPSKFRLRNFDVF